MRGLMGLIGLLATLAIGLFVYRSYFAGNGEVATQGTNNPRAVVDIVGVKNDLIAMAQAERTYLALNSHYATLEELRSDGTLQIDPARGRQGYTYSANLNGQHFTITATYSGPATGMPTLSIDETMQITQR